MVLSLVLLGLALITSFVPPVSDVSEPRFLSGTGFVLPLISFAGSKIFEYFAFDERGNKRVVFLFLQIPIFFLFVWSMNLSISMNLI